MGLFKKNYKQINNIPTINVPAVPATTTIQESPPIQPKQEEPQPTYIKASYAKITDASEYEGIYTYKVVANFKLNLGDCNISN